MAIGQDNLDADRGVKYTYYDYAERSSDAKYPSWVGAAPNLQTYINAINKSNPIIQCQYELVWNRWPRVQFFAKGITIPGLSVNTIDVNHAGFTIKIPTHVTYDSNDITLNILADKEGFHYYDLRNMVLQTGHPLVAGDPRSTVGDTYGLSPGEDIIEVRLRNSPIWDKTHHHWVIHNFKPIAIGDIELAQDGATFVEFELKGIFTHITYDCGKTVQSIPEPPEEPIEEVQPAEAGEEGPIDSTESDLDSTESDLDSTESGLDSTESGLNSNGYEDLRPMDSSASKIAAYMSGNMNIIDEETQLIAATNVMIPLPVFGEDNNMAKKCESALSHINNEFMKQIEEIPKMIEDSIFKKEYIQSETDMFVGGISNDGAKVMAGIQSKITLKSQAQKNAYEKTCVEYNEQIKGVMDNYINYRNLKLLSKNVLFQREEDKFDETTIDSNQLITQYEAVKFNHDKTGDFKVLIDPTYETDNYQIGMTQLTLPHRFGMYKTPIKNIPKKTTIKLEEPKQLAFSNSMTNPNHKIRSIFN